MMPGTPPFSGRPAPRRGRLRSGHGAPTKNNSGMSLWGMTIPGPRVPTFFLRFPEEGSPGFVPDCSGRADNVTAKEGPGADRHRGVGSSIEGVPFK